MSLKDIMRFKDYAKLPRLDEVLVTSDGDELRILREGKWINGHFERSIRIDLPTHGAGQKHAHVLGRKRNELGVVNFDGTASHGSKMTLHDRDADALRAIGFNIKPGNIVEWAALPAQPGLLFG